MTHVPRGILYLILRTLLYPWISRVRTLTADWPQLRQLEKDGQIIFVSNAASFIDFLIVDEQLRRNGMQGLGFTHGIGYFLVRPLGAAWSAFWSYIFKGESSRRAFELDELMSGASTGSHGYIFLKKSRSFDKRIDYVNGFFGRLVQERSQSGRKTFLVPTSVFLTRMRKKGTKRTYFEIFFGTYDIPGKVRKIYQLLANFHKGGTIFSKHIDLMAELERNEKFNDLAVDKRLRWTLLFHLNNEDRAYRGPTKRSKARKVAKILKEKRLNEELQKVAERTGRSFESVRKEAAKDLNDIASDTSERIINAMRMLFDYVWSRTLEGIDVSQEDLNMVRDLSRKGPVVCLPCHRSHVDYLSVAYMFEKQGLNYPRIAAGDNLSKWPLGPILRGCGAFFLRRSFKGETIFPLVFDAYLRHVLRERHVLLFFMEGGRSRTGKLLHPKMGMMSMVLDAWRGGVVEDLPLVPITIDYGKIFEGGAYVREKSGLPKQKENLKSVLQSRKVLRHKHGVMRLRFGQPIYLSKYVEEAGYTRETLGFKARIPLLNRLSYDVLNRINEGVTLTAGNIIAGLLMGTPRRGMTQSQLRGLFVLAVMHLHRRKVELAFTEKKLDLALENALASFEESETLVRVTVGGETVVNIPENKRAEMEYYKNNGLHYTLDVNLFCTALELLTLPERTMENVQACARELYDFLSYEFLIQGEFPTQEDMERAFRAMRRSESVDMDGELIVIQRDSELGSDLFAIAANMLVNFLESYLVVAETLAELAEEEQVEKKALLKKCLAKAHLLFAVGTLRRSESINHVTFGNALQYYSKTGYIKMRTPKGGKHVTVGLSQSKKEEFLALKDKVYRWLLRLV